MEIIELYSKDIKRYKEFFFKGLHEHPGAFRIAVNDEQNEPFPTSGEPTSFTLGYTGSTGELEGVISFKRETPNRERLNHKGLLFRMYVQSESSGKGIGAKLIDALIDKVKSQTDIEQINLTVVATNSRAKDLYEKHGFKSFSYEKNAIKLNGTYLDEETMVCFLY